MSGSTPWPKISFYSSFNGCGSELTRSTYEAGSVVLSSSAHAHLVIKLLMFIIEEIALKMSVFHSYLSSSIFTEQLIWE